MSEIEIKDRILRILTSENLSSSKFAEIVGVQRSSISHILSGRNKPSLDFLQKVLRNFPKINSDWLIIGKGEMFKMVEQTELGFAPPPKTSINAETPNNQHQDSESKVTENIVKQTVIKEVKPRNIQRIVVFYDDNTFEEQSPNKSAEK